MRGLDRDLSAPSGDIVFQGIHLILQGAVPMDTEQQGTYAETKYNARDTAFNYTRIVDQIPGKLTYHFKDVSKYHLSSQFGRLWLNQTLFVCLCVSPVQAI